MVFLKWGTSPSGGARNRPFIMKTPLVLMALLVAGSVSLAAEKSVKKTDEPPIPGIKKLGSSGAEKEFLGLLSRCDDNKD